RSAVAVRVHLGDGRGNFPDPNQLTVPVGANLIIVAATDFDHNGTDDLVVTSDAMTFPLAQVSPGTFAFAGRFNVGGLGNSFLNAVGRLGADPGGVLFVAGALNNQPPGAVSVLFNNPHRLQHVRLAQI